LAIAVNDLLGMRATGSSLGTRARAAGIGRFRLLNKARGTWSYALEHAMLPNN
jgi:hypothetical protein